MTSGSGLKPESGDVAVDGRREQMWIRWIISTPIKAELIVSGTCDHRREGTSIPSVTGDSVSRGVPKLLPESLLSRRQ